MRAPKMLAGGSNQHASWRFGKGLAKTPLGRSRHVVQGPPHRRLHGPLAMMNGLHCRLWKCPWARPTPLFPFQDLDRADGLDMRPKGTCLE